MIPLLLPERFQVISSDWNNPCQGGSGLRKSSYTTWNRGGSTRSRVNRTAPFRMRIRFDPERLRQRKRNRMEPLRGRAAAGPRRSPVLGSAHERNRGVYPVQAVLLTGPGAVVVAGLVERGPPVRHRHSRARDPRGPGRQSRIRLPARALLHRIRPAFHRWIFLAAHPVILLPRSGGSTPGIAAGERLEYPITVHGLPDFSTGRNARPIFGLAVTPSSSAGAGGEVPLSAGSGCRRPACTVRAGRPCDCQPVFVERSKSHGYSPYSLSKVSRSLV